MNVALSTRRHGSTWTAEFAIALQRIRVLPAEERQQSRDVALGLLSRQMDFIHSLHELGPDFAVDLRYLFDPARPFRVAVYLLFQLAGKRREEVLQQAPGIARHVFHLLRVNNTLHDFQVVQSSDALERLIHPFPFDHVAEIQRREEMVRLDALRKSPAIRVGFSSTDRSRSQGEGASIYYVFPFASHTDTMERLCNVLFLQEHPTLVSVCLRPHGLSQKDQEQLEDRAAQCEKYTQLSIGGASEPEGLDKIAPFLRTQAQAFYVSCSRELAHLRDAAYLLKVQVASSMPLARELVTVLGNTVTEHSGHPQTRADAEDLPRDLSGGYECYQPLGESSLKTARQNLEHMAFTPWAGGVAPHGFGHWRYLYDVSQAVAAFRLPLPVAAEFPGIETMRYHPKSAPSDLPAEGLLLGVHPYFAARRSIFLRDEDRRRHAYILGQTGTGKSTLFLSLVLQDIQQGKGLALIDPHGELIDQVMASIPGSRMEDVVYLNPRDLSHPVGMNFLEADTTVEKDFAVNYLLDVFNALYDMHVAGGPVFEMYMRNALQLLLDQPAGFHPTVLDVPRLFQDTTFRSALLQNCTNPYVVDFWRKEAEKAGGDHSLRNMSPYITSKLSRFVYNETMRCILGQRRSTIDFRAAMDERRILLLDLRKGILGDINSHFLGMLVVGKLFSAAISRTAVENKAALPDFTLYVDEFHNLATETFVSILSEARKYGLSLIVTNQYISQLRESLARGIFGNIGSLASFRVGAADAAFLAKEFGEMVSPNDLMGLPNYHAYVRLLINGEASAPFDIEAIQPPRSGGGSRAKAIRVLSRKKYGRHRAEVEQEIRKAWEQAEPKAG